MNIRWATGNARRGVTFRFALFPAEVAHQGCSAAQGGGRSHRDWGARCVLEGLRKRAPQSRFCSAFLHVMRLTLRCNGNCQNQELQVAYGATQKLPALPYFSSFVIASAALPATTQLADPATTASSSNHRKPKSSMHSGKSGLITMYPGITAPGMYALSARLLL
jgi:hypothetical protein